MTTNSADQGGVIDLTELPLQQLQAVRQQLEEEIQILTQSFTQLKQAQAKFHDCIESLRPIAPENADNALLIPITNSLYVPGKLKRTGSVVIDVGTGYYIEKKVPDAVKFYERKITYLQGNLDKLQETVSGKQNNMRVLVDVLQYKTAMAMKAAKEAQAKA
ncbi:subunit of tubulin prefoldin [Sorochytrium milnesiophthora]